MKKLFKANKMDNKIKTNALMKNQKAKLSYRQIIIFVFKLILLMRKVLKKNRKVNQWRNKYEKWFITLKMFNKMKKRNKTKLKNKWCQTNNRGISSILKSLLHLFIQKFVMKFRKINSKKKMKVKM